MSSYGAFDAKTHFSELLGRVVEGEKIIITKHGVQIAMIIPFPSEKETLDPIDNAIRAIRKLRKGTTLGKKLNIRKMREEGRK